MHETPPLPGRRRGPRPLLMHLALAAMRSSGLPSAWPSSSEDWQRWSQTPNPPAANHPVAIQADAALIRGIACYRSHPWSRDVVDPPSVWQDGETRLLDFGGQTSAPPLLLVPSLVNRATILDLAQGHSMARALAAAGLRVFLLDWGWPDEAALKFDLDALITGRLAQAIDHAAGVAGPVTLVGYCMGGLLAVAAAQLQPQRVAGLALLATPWNFHAGNGNLDISRLLGVLEPALQLTGTLPVDALQMLFAIGDPHGVGNKYRAFGATDQTTDRARQFVSVEDWLNDGVPLAAPIARQCLAGWYGENAPARGTWQVAGHTIAPASLDLPCFAAIPGRDRIVPPESAAALAALLPQAKVVHPRAGHVGMVAGSSAATELWAPLAEWARAIPDKSPGLRKRRRKPNISE